MFSLRGSFGLDSRKIGCFCEFFSKKWINSTDLYKASQRHSENVHTFWERPQEILWRSCAAWEDINLSFWSPTITSQIFFASKHKEILPRSQTAWAKHSRTLQFVDDELTCFYLTQDRARTAADMSAAEREDRGWNGWIVIGAIVGNTITAPRKNTASIMAVPRGVVSSRTRVLLTLFRSWGPGACRYSAVPTCAPPPYSELTSR